jgi:heme-degrading monooxygenase HmoA
MTHLIARSDVDEFDEWKASFDEFTEARVDHGCTRFTVLRGVDDPDHVTVVMEFDTEADARSWADYVDEDAQAAAGMHETDLTVFEVAEDWAGARATT